MFSLNGWTKFPSSVHFCYDVQSIKMSEENVLSFESPGIRLAATIYPKSMLIIFN